MILLFPIIKPFIACPVYAQAQLPRSSPNVARRSRRKHNQKDPKGSVNMVVEDIAHVSQASTINSYIHRSLISTQLTTDQDHMPVTLVTHSSPPPLEATLPSDMLVSLLPSQLRVGDSEDDKISSSTPSPSPDTSSGGVAGIVAELDTETAEGECNVEYYSS